MKMLSIGLLLTLAFTTSASAKEFSLPRADEVIRSFAGSRPVAAPAGQQIEVGFSPKQGAKELVLNVINSSTKSVRVAAYSFTSAPVVSTLLAAHRRGVEVAVIVDYRNNFVEGCGDRGACKGKHAVGTLVNAGIPVSVIDKYAIFTTSSCLRTASTSSLAASITREVRLHGTPKTLWQSGTIPMSWRPTRQSGIPTGLKPSSRLSTTDPPTFPSPGSISGPGNAPSVPFAPLSPCVIHYSCQAIASGLFSPSQE
jgi:hypothetical protein